MLTNIAALPPEFVGLEYAQVLTAIEFGTPSQQRSAVAHYFEDLEQIFGEVADRARGGRQNRQEADYLTRTRFGAVEKAGSMLFEVVKRGWLESYPDLEWLDELVRRQIEAGQAGPVIRNPGALWMSVSGSSFMKLSDGEIVTPRPMYHTAFEDPELDSMLWLPEDQVPTGGIEEALAQDWLRSGAICRRLADAVRERCTVIVPFDSGGTAHSIDATRQLKGVHPSPDPVAGNVFEKTSNTWRIKFNGTEMSGVQDAKPLRDIHYLLSRANKSVSIFDLPDNKGSNVLTTCVMVATKGDSVQLRRQIEDHKRYLGNLEDTGAMPVEIREAEVELEALMHQWNANFNKRGRPRSLTGPLKNAVNRTRKRFKRLLDEWTKADESKKLATFLKKNVKIDTNCKYEPPPNFPPWET